jgi:hypothetical protein
MSRPRPILVPVALSLALLSLGLLLTGCGKAPAPVLDMKISDGDWKDYTDSLQAIAGRQTAEERTEFAKALQELKYHAISGEGLSPGPEIYAALREQLAGLAVRQVLVTGLSIKLGRKQEEQKALLRSFVMNARLRTKPGDDASAEFLESVRGGQSKQLQSLHDEISALKKRIEELGPARRPQPF